MIRGRRFNGKFVSARLILLNGGVYIPHLTVQIDTAGDICHLKINQGLAFQKKQLFTTPVGPLVWFFELLYVNLTALNGSKIEFDALVLQRLFISGNIGSFNLPLNLIL